MITLPTGFFLPPNNVLAWSASCLVCCAVLPTVPTALLAVAPALFTLLFTLLTELFALLMALSTLFCPCDARVYRNIKPVSAISDFIFV